MRISFGPFAFDRQSRLLWRDGEEIALPPRVLGVLELLIDRAGQVVARQELLDGVWKDAFVTDTSLAEAVSFLRQALGDDPQSPRYIQTVHRRGYRFLSPVVSDPPVRGLTPESAEGVPLRGLTPDGHFAVSSGARAVSATSEGVTPSIGWELLPWSAAVLCASLAAAAAWWIARQPAPEAPPVARFDVPAVAGTRFDDGAPALAVSADGRALAWSACDTASGVCALYARAIDRFDAARLPGTEGASAPFFSPDGRWIGFFADGKLRKIAASGGSPSNLADAPSPGGASWGPDGRIVFSGAAAGGLSVVADQGGAATTLTTPRIERGEVRHLYPAWLPGGGVIFSIALSPIADAPGDLAALAPRSRQWKTLRSGVTRAVSAGPAYLLLSSGRDLQAASFDERTLTPTGGADSVLASVTGGDGIVDFAVGGGTIAAIAAPGSPRARWSDEADAGAVARLSSIAIAPDSRRAAGVIPDGSGSDVWVADLGSGALTRITYGGTNVSPAWSADGTRVFFATRTTGAFALASRRVDDRTGAQNVPAGTSQLFPSAVAADGRIAATLMTPGGHTAAAIVPAGGGDPRPLPAGPFDEGSPVFSPDGRWIALESNESGRVEIVLRDLRDGRRLPVSSDGGSHPRWSADGRWIYFDAGRKMLRAAFDDRQGPVVRAPEVLFDRADARVLAVTPAGRLLIASRASAPARVFVVLQWLRELRQRLPLPVTAPR